MYAVIVRTRGDLPAAADGPAAGAWREAVRSSAQPGDGLEHVYVLIDGSDVGIVLWIAATDAGGAEWTARRLIERAVAADAPSAAGVTGFQVVVVTAMTWIPQQPRIW
jgi:hypothetical protein